MSFVGNALSSVGQITGGLLGLSSGQQTSAAGAAATQASLDQLAYQQEASNQLQTLQSDPSSLTSTGGYKLGMDAAQRGLASRGLLSSGNEQLALQEYGQNYYVQQVQLLQSLASGMPNTVNALNTSTSIQSSGAGGIASMFGLLGQGVNGLSGLFGGGANGMGGLFGGGSSAAGGFVGAGGAAASWAGSAGAADAVGGVADAAVALA